MKKVNLFIGGLLFLAQAALATSNVHDVDWSKLQNCKYDGPEVPGSRSYIGDKFVSGENLRWIKSNDATDFIRDADTVTDQPYPFKLLSDVYRLPNGSFIFISESTRDFSAKPLLTIFKNRRNSNARPIFDLVANLHLPTVQVEDNKLLFDSFTCDLPSPVNSF